MEKISVKSICQNIWDMEEKYNLLNKKINDVYFWKLIRNNIFHEVSKQNNLFGQAHTSTSPKFIDKLLYLPKALINTHLYGALKRDSQRDVLIFEHPRKVNVDGKYMDKHTHYLLEDLNDVNYEIIDRPYLRKHFNKPSNNRSYFEHFSFIDYLKRKVFTVKINSNDKKIIKKIEKELKNRFNLKIDLLKIIKFKITHFKNEVKYFNKLLKKRKPKKVFLVVSYAFEALIEACRINNITSIEIQHGTISKYHLGYSFPYDSDVPYFPDKIYLFGQYWSDSTPLPLEEHNFINYGFPYLEKRLQEYKGNIENKKQVLFISQGTIGKKLSEFAYDYAKSNPEYKVLYKLHPGEYDRWQRDYKILKKAYRLNNFKIIDNNKIHLYKLFAESEFQVGVYSTAIYEGLTLNCKTILIDLPGIEYMDYLIEEDIVEFAQNNEELSQLIKEDNFDHNYDKHYFFNGV